MKLSNRQIKRELERAERSHNPNLTRRAIEKLQTFAGQMKADDWRNWFDGVEVVRMRISANRTESIRVRQTVDGRLRRSLTYEQTGAALSISMALEIITAGIGYRTNKFVFSSPGHEVTPDWQHQLIQRYMIWARQAVRQKIDIFAIISVLGLGWSCRSVDKTTHHRHGWAKRNLISGLELYEELGDTNHV